MTLKELEDSFLAIFNTIPSDMWVIIGALNPLLKEGEK